MLDGYNREIQYLRISITDRCDLRCRYCMPPGGVPPLRHADILSYEEIIRLARIFSGLGIRKIRLTGGEPLVRQDVPRLVQGLKAIPGVESVFMTSNGILLGDCLPQLVQTGLDGVNVSLDAVDREVYYQICRRDCLQQVLRSIDRALACSLPLKLNCVPNRWNRRQIVPLTRYAMERDIPLRFIELMPIGEGKNADGLSEAQVKDLIAEGIGPLTPAPDHDPAYKCRYFLTPGGGKIGFISALSHKFCRGCDRIRLTANGFLKACLQYDARIDLKPLLRETDETIRQAIAEAIRSKPQGHHFGLSPKQGDESGRMSQIGG
ncbi:MAG: GTP 3',8-cyclase MoaA [Firmicutes bacterium]|nr:GTP 3',8-cyclase MoaA [Bacillota bacterium]